MFLLSGCSWDEKYFCWTSLKCGKILLLKHRSVIPLAVRINKWSVDIFFIYQWAFYELPKRYKSWCGHNPIIHHTLSLLIISLNMKWNKKTEICTRHERPLWLLFCKAASCNLKPELHKYEARRMLWMFLFMMYRDS